MKYRSRSDIITSILETTRTGATKTKIMYKSYLSYSQTVSYVKLLQEYGLVLYEDGAQLYRTTDKGFKLLSLSNEINDIMASKERTREIY